MKDTFLALSAPSTLLKLKSTALPSISHSRTCRDIELRLPSHSSIEHEVKAAGVSPDVAKQLSDTYLDTIRTLQDATRQEYAGALNDLQECHLFCPPNQPCSLIAGVKDAFHHVYMEKSRSILTQLRSQVAERFPRPLATVQDHTPILEFAYTKSTKPTAQEKAVLSQVTGLTTKQVSVWFQNRRTREKAGAATRRPPPQTISELGDKLREQQRLHKDFHMRKKMDADSDSDSHDSGYASASSVDEITKMLDAFSFNDEEPSHPISSRKVARRRPSNSSDDAEEQSRIPKRQTGKKRKSPSLSVQPSPEPGSPYPADLQHHPELVTSHTSCRASPYLQVSLCSADPPSRLSGAIRRRPPCEPQPSQHGLASLPRRQMKQTPSAGAPDTTCSLSSVASTSRIAPSCLVDEPESTRANKAGRPQKKASLPTRRPKGRKTTTNSVCVSSSSSSSSISTPASSRVTSLSSNSSFDFLPSRLSSFTCSSPEEPVLYTKNAEGDFVPVASANFVLSPEILVPPPVKVAFPDPIPLGSPKDFGLHSSLVSAPDDAPRAFSANLLQSAYTHSSADAVCTTDDFSALLDLLSGNPNSFDSPDADSSVPPFSWDTGILLQGHSSSDIPITPASELLSATAVNHDMGALFASLTGGTDWWQALASPFS